MKVLYLFMFLSFMLSVSLEAQECVGFENGTFEVRSEYGVLLIERKDNWQLEKSKKYGATYLGKIEKLSDCKFILRYYKIIDPGVLPEPDMSNYATTEIIKVNNNEYSFISIFSPMDFETNGKYIKVSDSISDQLKSLIKKENEE